MLDNSKYQSCTTDTQDASVKSLKKIGLKTENLAQALLMKRNIYIFPLTKIYKVMHGDLFLWGQHHWARTWWLNLQSCFLMKCRSHFNAVGTCSFLKISDRGKSPSCNFWRGSQITGSFAPWDVLLHLS